MFIAINFVEDSLNMFKKIIGNVNLITIDDFYQAQPTRDK
jgi:hypothetical protein